MSRVFKLKLLHIFVYIWGSFCVLLYHLHILFINKFVVNVYAKRNSSELQDMFRLFHSHSNSICLLLMHIYYKLVTGLKTNARLSSCQIQLRQINNNLFSKPMKKLFNWQLAKSKATNFDHYDISNQRDWINCLNLT